MIDLGNQEELKAFLALQKIEYTEDRMQFYQDIDEIFASDESTIYAVWSCKLREWSNILSISGYVDSEKYFLDLMRRIAYAFKGQSFARFCRSASDEIMLFCCLGDSDIESIVTNISERLLEDAKYSFKIGTTYIQNRLSVGICYGNKGKSLCAINLICEAKIVMDQLVLNLSLIHI